MIYFAASIWMIVVVLLAWGVNHLLSRITSPKAVNSLLLPGTLIAQLGQILALLITGATVSNAALMKGDAKGEPAAPPMPQPKLPVVGPMLVALIPMAVLGLMIYIVAIKLGGSVVGRLPGNLVAADLPLSMAAFWEQLRGLITLSEQTLGAMRSAEAPTWKLVLFGYLLACLTVRLGPLPGNFRGNLGAIAALGLIAWLADSIAGRLADLIRLAWPILTLTVGWLLIMLMTSLIVRGVMLAARSMNQGPTPA